MVVRRIAVVLALTLAGAAMVAAPAGSETDTSEPVWRKTVTGSVPVGGVLRGPFGNGCDDGEEYTLPMSLSYRAVDRQSGIDHYELSGPFVFVETSERRFPWEATTMDHSCGGGAHFADVYAYNGAGLYSFGGTYGQGTAAVTQDEPSAEVTYSGDWATSNCACWSDGTTRRTTEQGASVTYQVPSPLYSHSGRQIDNSHYILALVMAQGPDRGVAAVFVDDVKVGRVNTNAPTKANGTVVWRRTLTPGSHTVTVVNRATEGSPRIDIDAFVVVKKTFR
jgi:hypothetical protein